MPVMSDGIRSGVNWMRLKSKIQDLGERADQQRLGQPRHADEQAVAAGEQGDQEFLDDSVLADDDLADLAEHGVPFVGKLFDLGDLMLLYLRWLPWLLRFFLCKLIGAARGCPEWF